MCSVHIFILFTNVYIRAITTKQYTLKTCGDVVSHRAVFSNVFLCWNYKTNVRSSIDAKTFYTQLTAFNLMKNLHEDFEDTLMEEILNNDLSLIATKSELLL